MPKDPPDPPEPLDPLIRQAEEIMDRLAGKPGTKPVKLHRWADVKKRMIASGKMTQETMDRIDRQVDEEVRKSLN